MRALLVLFSCAAVVAADPFIEATGQSLEDFDVVVRLDQVKRQSPRALAESFARFQTEQRIVERKFGRLFHEAHTAVLARYFALEAVRREKAVYAQVAGRRRGVEYTVESAGEDEAVIQRTWKEKGHLRRKSARLAVANTYGGYVIRAIHDPTRDGGWVERDIGTPPKLPDFDVPDFVAGDRSSPQAAVDSLRREMARLRAVRGRAMLELQQHFFSIVSAFYGADAAKRARAGQKKVKLKTERVFEIHDPAPRPQNRMRVAVTATEAVDRKTRAPVGQAAFDLEKSGDGWRIVTELHQLAPDQPLQPIDRNLGLFFFLFS